MKAIKTTLFALTLCLFSTVNAQWQPTGNLTFFSDNGKKFFVILNGEKYNEVPQTNVRIEELPNPYYSCKIIFEDQTIPLISKNMVMVTDQNNVFMDVTYRIKENNGKYTIGFMPYSFIPAQQNMARPAGAAVYRYGTPLQQYNYNAQPATTVFTQPTQTVIVTQPAPTMSVNVPGMSVNVGMPTTTEVITTTSSMPIQNGVPVQQYPNGGGNYNGCQYPMNPSNFSSARQTIANETFDDTRVSTAQQIVSSNCLTSDQILNITQLFTYESNKLSFAKFAYQYCIDRNNYFKVVNAFTFSSSKTDLNNYIQSVR